LIKNGVGISKEISFGMNGFACRKPWYRLKLIIFRLSSLKKSLIAEALMLFNSQ